MNTHPLARENCKPTAGTEFVAKNIRYKLGGKLGDGAVGVVRKATRIDNGQSVAVKFLAPDPKYINPDSFDDVAARFKREGSRGPKLAHEGLLDIFAYAENTNGENFAVSESSVKNPFLVMERVDGKTLESYIKSHPNDVGGRIEATPERLAIACRIAEALDYLHRRKLVHRDIKPANIFLSRSSSFDRPGTVKVGDFGIMKWGDFHRSISTGTLTMTAHIGLGTLKYMSPEQALNPKSVTVRSDTFSLGVTLIELFTGKIMPNIHHVMAVTQARMSRGTIQGKLATIGMGVGHSDTRLASMILDMHLRGARGRPSIRDLLGHLTYLYERSVEQPDDDDDDDY